MCYAVMAEGFLFPPAQIKQRNAFVFDGADYAAFVEAAVVTSPAKLILHFLQSGLVNTV